MLSCCIRLVFKLQPHSFNVQKQVLKCLYCGKRSARSIILYWFPFSHSCGCCLIMLQPCKAISLCTPHLLFPSLLTHAIKHSQAQTWVGKMTASGPDEPNDKDFEGRPSRLGLGAKVAPGVKRAAPTNPVERKLLGKVNAQKREAMEDEN
ncbi:hypothetical protein PAHAL_4G002000 [Panicum hallii]|uniref:Uncharacterized protein n=1 Tax=Panicum hallii TaxID=206008 RepID=A0A2T8JBC5_9POAL|nr:hypothetical protein PAHAL_4G002000 [Panicum hallii]